MATAEVEDEVGTSGRGEEGVESMASDAGEEMSPDPDSLKNTPSNIARLEDVIEQCSGRQKYLARTKSPSDGVDVRWYFCKVPFAENELAASVPRTEIVGKGEYFRFGMRDSLALEAAFLRREEELLKYWWTEYAECSDGPNGSLKHTTSIKHVTSTSSKANQETDHGTIDEERVGVPVKGGLYEVDLERRHCFPVYWNGENRRVLRGHWFARKNGLDWFPLREDVAEQLEFAYRCQVWHRRTFQPSGLFAARVDLQGTTQGIHALFTGEDDTWEAWLGVDNSGISQVISSRLNGVKLRRGFSTSGLAKPSQDELRQQKEEEMDDYCSQVPVRHLVFMVHGIGQRLEKANLVDDVGDFRHITASLAERHLTSYQRSIQRVLFIPCQWRRCLKFSGETAVEKCTLDGVRGLRVMLGATTHDILYYMSPIYCQDIIDSVSNQLNRLYLKFIKRNPGYDGKVSIYGHSLGSVLSYDILCHQSRPSSPFSFNSMYANHGQVKGHQVDEGSGQSNSFVSTKEKNYNTSGNNFVDGDVLASDCKNTVPEVGNVEKDSSCSMSNVKEDFRGDHLPQCMAEEPEPSLIDCSVSSQLVDAKLPPREVLGLYPQPCEARNDLNFNMNFEDRASDDKDQLIAKLKHEVMNFEGRASDDKDQLIAKLNQEVHFLNAKIAELESRKKSSIEGGDEVYDTGPNEQRKSYTPYIKYTKLEFEVDTFFAVGSPLAVFLALRNIRIGIGRGQDYWEDEKITEEMPACKQMYNIFHPFDPVAFRVEPLVCKEYVGKRPVIVPYHKGGKRLHIGFQEFTEDLALRSQAFVSQLNSVKVKMVSIFQKRQNKMIEATEGVSSVDGRTYGSFMMQMLTGSEDGRVDHVLQDKTFQHPYISAIGSHTNYWRDPDTALFILNHLYHHIPEEPDSPGVSDGRRNKPKNNNNVGLLYQTDPLDEDLPLTFSDEQLIRAFSRKVRKAMSKT